MNKQFVLIFLVCGFLLSAKAMADKPETVLPFDEDIRWSLQALPPKVDNLDWRSLDRWYIIKNVFDTLVAFDTSQNLVAAAAASWEISGTRLQYTFHLRKDLKFSNGRKITASDVVYSIKRCLIQQDKDNLLRKTIKGAASIKTVDDSMDGIKAIGDYDVQINLDFPLENIWSFLSQPEIGGIVDRESIDPKTLIMNGPVISSGPYVVTQSSPEHYRLIANVNYYGYSDSDTPRTVGLYAHSNTTEAVKWFFDGKTNFYALLDPFQTERIDELLKHKSIVYPLHRIGFLYLNAKSKFLAGEKMREGIFNTLLKKQLVKLANPLLLWGNSFFPPGSPGYFQESEIDKGVPLQKQNIPVTFEVLLEKGIPTHEIENLISERMSAIGINVKFMHLSKHEIVKRFANGNFDMGMTSVGFSMADHGFSVYDYFIDTPPYFNDPTGKIHKLFYKITHTPDASLKNSMLKGIGGQILEDKLIIPLYHTAVRYILSDQLEIARPKNRSRVDMLFTNLHVKRSGHETYK